MIVKKTDSFKKLLAFGCSITFGEELNESTVIQSDFFKNSTRAKSLYKIKTLDFNDIANTLKVEDHKFWHEMLKLDYDNFKKECHFKSYPGVLSSLLNVTDYRNYSIPGASNISILSELVRNSANIDSDTLVIIGVTFPLRKTKLLNDSYCLYSFPTLFYFPAIPAVERLIAATSDDDSIEQDLHVLHLIKSILDNAGCSYLIFNAVGFKESLFDDINQILFIPNVIPLNDDSYAKSRCFLGHPGSDVHITTAQLLYKELMR
jgi:hypothetical protein